MLQLCLIRELLQYGLGFGQQDAFDIGRPTFGNSVAPVRLVADLKRGDMLFDFCCQVAGTHSGDVVNKFRDEGINYPQVNLLTLIACQKRYTEICNRY